MYFVCTRIAVSVQFQTQVGTNLQGSSLTNLDRLQHVAQVRRNTDSVLVEFDPRRHIFTHVGTICRYNHILNNASVTFSPPWYNFSHANHMYQHDQSLTRAS